MPPNVTEPSVDVAFTPAGQEIFESFWARAFTAQREAAPVASANEEGGVIPAFRSPATFCSEEQEVPPPRHPQAGGVGLESAFGKDLAETLPPELRGKLYRAAPLIFPYPQDLIPGEHGDGDGAQEGVDPS